MNVVCVDMEIWVVRVKSRVLAQISFDLRASVTLKLVRRNVAKEDFTAWSRASFYFYEEDTVQL